MEVKIFEEINLKNQNSLKNSVISDNLLNNEIQLNEYVSEPDKQIKSRINDKNILTEAKIGITINDNLEERLQLCESTMPGLFISIMVLKGKPVFEKDLFECVIARLDSLRKPDGSKYKITNLKKSIASTLCSSGIFQKIDEDQKTWFYKESEALHYLERITEKTHNKKKKEINIKEENSKEMKFEYLKNKIKKSKDNNLKYLKASNVLSELLMKFKNSNELRRKIKNPFNKCMNADDLIKKLHGDENKLIGILISYKFFKPLINKIIKLITSRKKQEIDININNINDANKQSNISNKNINSFQSTIAGLESKIEMFQQLFQKLGQNVRDSHDYEDSN